MIQVSRMHRDDWSLNIIDRPSFAFSGYSPQPRFVLSLSLTLREVHELVNQPGRGYPAFSPRASCFSELMISADGIEVTREEANRIAGGEHPRHVLFWSDWPDGWRVIIMPDPLTERGS